MLSVVRKGASSSRALISLGSGAILLLQILQSSASKLSGLYKSNVFAVEVMCRADWKVGWLEPSYCGNVGPPTAFEIACSPDFNLRPMLKDCRHSSTENLYHRGLTRELKKKSLHVRVELD